MNTSQVLQTVRDLRAVAALVRNIETAQLVSTIEQALRDGPAKQPELWRGGVESLQSMLVVAKVMHSFHELLETVNL